MIDRGPIVIYASKTGFTARYSLWIAEKLECPFITYKEASVAALQHYSTLIFGGWLNAGRITGIEYVRKHLKEFPEQNIVLFCTGGAPAEEQDMGKIRQTNLTEGLEDLPLYYLPAGVRPDQLKGFNKLAIKMVAKVHGRKDPEKGERYKNGFDLSKPEYVDELVEYVKSSAE